MARTSRTKAEAKPAANGNRRPETEQWLEESGLSWDYDPAFPLADIDQEKSLANQARLGEPINDETLEEYREALRRGDKFPALVVAKPGVRTRAVNIDGNHRYVAAAAEGLETFGAYVVSAKVTHPKVETMMAEANAKHGRVTPVEDRIQQALHMIDNRGWGVEKAAASVALPLSTLRSRYDKVRADRRADEVGLKRSDWDSLNATVRTRLLTISTDEGFKAASRLAVAAALSTAQVDEMVAALRESKSSGKQEQIVRALRRDYADRIKDVSAGTLKVGGGRGFTPRTRLTMVLHNLMSMPQDLVSSIASTYDDDERGKTAQEARDAAARLQEFADALEK